MTINGDQLVPASGPKRQKKSKFGRSELRSVTRTTRRNDSRREENLDDGGIANRGEEGEAASDDEINDDFEGGVKKTTIASKRMNRRENKMAYSALISLLKSEHDIDELKKSKGGVPEESANEEDEQNSDVGSDEEQVHDNLAEAAEDCLDEKEKMQDNIDVHNKYDSFNLHFNQEEEISKAIDKYESLPVKDRRLKLISKEEIADDDEKYVKYRYGYPQANPELGEERKTGTTLEEKLKFHNVKKKIQEKFNGFSDIRRLDTELIESMLTYETLNFQYLNNEEIKGKYQDYYLLHAMNHLMKTRDRILNNNEKKSLYEKRMKEGSNDEENDDGIEPEYRDQGYTRPKILILLPSRNFAYTVVSKLIDNLQMENVENKKKFKTQFYDSSKISDRVYHSRPKDFEEYFDGNTSDLFVLGIKYTRKTLKLYSPLEQSDIIVASPIGLLKLYNKIESQTQRKKVDKNDKNNEGMKNNFLSSIEICILDKAEGMMMQNWSNVVDIFKKHLNQTPKEFINVDFSRIRMWAINEQSGYLTQFLCFDKYTTPEMISLVKGSKNVLSGSTSYIPLEQISIIDSTNYKLYQLGLINKFERLKQIFMRFDFDESSIANEPEKRFEFFKNVVLPQMNKSSYKYGTLIYIPSYFDYLRVKKYLNDESSISFVAIDEYSSNSRVTRNRALFKNKANTATLMLYTERLHFYKRFDLKGVRNVIFYQLPSDPDFYQQVLEFIANEKLRVDAEKSKTKMTTAEDVEDSDEEEDQEDDLDLNLCTVRSIYSKLDAMRFGPIVGTDNVARLARGANELTEFS
ncbi:hypothetical protein PMKS-002727 [Pichia membranifaciens]|uniref:U3 small nucleolar RNA-associated protein 25 n=1 Tax=Pichia membranifaciens TaxID=4926 RepID=A0A1Q2YI98_9ASCO|nr:hypothetical protein PMKS-002727 [Pichia membranifaciens]